MNPQEIVFKMETYGQKVRVIDGKEYQDSKFADFSNVIPITDFKVLPEGGCETWVKGEKYPIRGCFNSKCVTVHGFKRLIPTLLRTLEGNVFHKLIGLLYLKKNWKKFIEFVHYGMKDVYLEPHFYCQPVREVYRVIKDEVIRDVVCAILEYDDAYRYRFQDIMGEFKPRNFALTPLDEIKRMARIFAIREGEEGAIVTDKVLKGVKLLCFYLKFNKKLLNELKAVAERIDLDELKFSKEDIWWTNKFGWYKYRGLGLEMRQKLNV